MSPPWNILAAMKQASNKIWIVSTGYYSDRRNLAAFSTEAGAKEFAELIDQSSIEDFEVDSFCGKFPKGMQLYRLWMNREGGDVFYYVTDPELNISTRFKYEGDRRMTECWARDGEHATKIANERRAQEIANGLWVQEARRK